MLQDVNTHIFFLKNGESRKIHRINRNEDFLFKCTKLCSNFFNLMHRYVFSINNILKY